LTRRNATLRADIARELREHADDQVRQLAAHVADGDARWLAGLLAGLCLDRVNHYVADLLDLERALLRVADGTYGTCVACGEPIDPMTLEFKPRTATCSHCARPR
jgi:RNA polymerase-binding transcription factor DksA